MNAEEILKVSQLHGFQDKIGTLHLFLRDPTRKMTVSPVSRGARLRLRMRGLPLKMHSCGMAFPSSACQTREGGKREDRRGQAWLCDV